MHRSRTERSRYFDSWWFRLAASSPASNEGDVKSERVQHIAHFNCVLNVESKLRLPPRKQAATFADEGTRSYQQTKLVLYSQLRIC